MNGLWTINIPDRGACLVLDNGTIRGGNNTYYYLGTYQQDGDTLRGKCTCQHYQGKLDSVFGTPKIDVIISGTVQGGQITGTLSIGPRSMPFTATKRD